MTELKYIMQHGQKDQHDFHPPLIRLQRRPPHPQGRRVLWVILSLIIFLIGWSLLGRLDIVAVAEGRLVPANYLKIVQPAEAGIVREILIRKGDEVRAGQVLLRMDALVTEAELEIISIEHARRRVQLARIDAELTGRPFDAPANAPVTLVREAIEQHRANREALTAALSEEQTRLVQAQLELSAARQQKSRLEAVLPHYLAQEQAFEQLVKTGFAGVLMGSEKRRQRIEREQELETQVFLVAAASMAIEQSQRKLHRIKADYQRALHAERNEAQAHWGRLTQELEKQEHRRLLLELRAPQDGVIKDLATHTAGTVVSAGTVLASLVPQDARLKAEVWVSNRDIGFVRPGQKVQLKFATFPFQRFGMGNGTVEFVSADAQSLEEARQQGHAGVGENALRYRAHVALAASELEMNGEQFPLAAGMHTTAEIKLGNRTVMEFLLSPVKRAWHEAGRER